MGLRGAPGLPKQRRLYLYAARRQEVRFRWVTNEPACDVLPRKAFVCLCAPVCVCVRGPPRTVHALAVIDETPQKAEKRMVANQREGD